MTETNMTEIIRCPVHGIPDCSPLLNGCSLPSKLADAYQLGYAAGTASPTADEIASRGPRDLTVLFDYEDADPEVVVSYPTGEEADALIGKVLRYDVGALRQEWTVVGVTPKDPDACTYTLELEPRP